MCRPRKKSEFMDALYARHAGLMFQTALDFGVSQEDAEDIVSAGMLALMKNADLLADLGEDSLKIYIVKTMRRTAINMLSRDTLRHRRERLASSRLYPTADDYLRADERMLASDQLEYTLEAIESLSDNLRACVKLKFLLHKTDRQIALETGLSESTVRKYIGRARKQIRKKLSEAGEAKK